MLFRCDLCLYVNHFKFMLTKVAISTIAIFYLFNHRHGNYHLLLIS